MKILVDVRLLSKGGCSGIEEYTRHIIARLLLTDRSNSYFLFYNGFHKHPLPKEWLDNQKTKIINWRLPNKLFDFSSKFLNFPKIDNFFKVDVVYSPHINILKTKRAKRILTVHDLSFIHHPYFFTRKARLWHQLQDFHKQAKQADLIITNSNFSKQDIVETLGVSVEKVAVVYEGVDPIFRSPIKQSPPPMITKLKPYILYLGTIEPRKNIDLIIHAFNLLKTRVATRDLKLVIAGGWGWLYQGVLAAYNKSPFKKDFLFLGTVKSGDRPSLYQQAEAFVYPSFFEGFGLPPLEAQACGCPVIASNRTSLPEILNNSALLISPWKFDELADKIETVITNGQLKQVLIRKGLENSQKFDWQNTANKILEKFNYK